MLRTLKRDAVCGFSSVLSFATRTFPINSEASSSITGPIIRHGPHHGAHISTRTGIGDCSTSRAKFASVTVIEPVGEARRALHCPHIGSALFSSETRTLLVVPHEGQRINCVELVLIFVSNQPVGHPLKRLTALSLAYRGDSGQMPATEGVCDTSRNP